ERYQVHEMIYATFQAPCFVLEEEVHDRVFRGKALSAYLGEQLQARRMRVGDVERVFMGACYFREAEVGGLQLGLSVNWDWDLQKGWLRVSPRTVGGKAEAEELCDILREILNRVDGLGELEWHTGGQDDKEVYSVTFTNMADPSADPAAGEYHLRTNRGAQSEEEALEQVLRWVLGLNSRGGL